MLTQDIAVRAKRKLTNRLIAAHDAARLRPHLTDHMMLIAGDGDLIDGADAVVTAFASQFAASGFITYERSTTSIEITDDGQRVLKWATGPETGKTAVK
jgi:hypothetical protein